MRIDSNIQKLVKVSKEVSIAIEKNLPIVALESTIITHGMPFPDNYGLAIEAERIVRDFGCIPATIAVLKGRINVGLNERDIKFLAEGENFLKLSTSDLSLSLVQGATGSTTVAATLVIADLINISVFATGGIGGAHRGSETNFDISADLKQLANSSVNLICAGPKAILDIPKTIELLETLGVPLITFRSENIPAFWSRDSGLKSPNVAENIMQIVNSYQARSMLGLRAGQLICNPIPRSEEIKQNVIEPLVQSAVVEALERKIGGKELTPFLLAKVLSLTGGQSVTANKGLFINNVKLASKIAKKLASFKNC